jgi:three-Cys-motif partner protein
MKSWGGDWTKQKLDAFEKYVRAYLKIMNKQKEKYNGWPTTIYFDGFAGSGINLPKEDNLKSDPLNGLELEKEASQYYVGAAERVVSMDLIFDEY